MPQKTYVNRATLDVLPGVEDHRDIAFSAADWSRQPSGLNELLAAGVPKRHWIFDPPGSDALREMNEQEKSGVDTDPAQLALARNAKRDELFTLITTFIESRYPSRVRAALSELRPGATGQVAATLDDYFQWHRSAWSAYRAAVTTVNNAPTIAAVEAVAPPNLGQLAAQDPGITVDQGAP